MPFTPPPNESARLARLAPKAQAIYAQTRQTANGILADQPYLSGELFTQFLDGQLNNSRSTPQLRSYISNFANQSVPAYAPQDQEAWQALAKKMTPKGLVERLTNQVYDSDNGGLQIVKLIGGLVGGAMAFQLTGGGGEGGWLGIIGLGLGVAMGVAASGMAQNWLNKPPANPLPASPGLEPGLARAPELALAPAQQPSLASAKLPSALPALPPAATMSAQETGGLPSPPRNLAAAPRPGEPAAFR